MLKLMKSLTLTLGQEFRNQLHTNFVRIEDYINKIKNENDYHKKEELNAHDSKQITDNKFITVDRGLEVISARYSNLVLSEGKNSLQEVKDARVDNSGKAHLSLFDRLQSDSVRFELNKDEVMKTVVDAKDKVLAQEFAFDIPNQSWQYLTNLSPWTNSVMQHFHLDNKTGLFYMTQVYDGGYKITKMKSNGQIISQMAVPQGGHGTHNGYRWKDDKLWIYSFINDDEGFNKLVRFSYRDDATITYGDYDMEEVNAFHDEHPYITPVINELEDKILLRIEYPKEEWSMRGAMNYVEIRSLADVDAGIDNVLQTMDIPMRLTDSDSGQPMQGVAFGEDRLYWYTGDSNPDYPNFVTVFDLNTKEELFQKQADVGKSGNEYPGNFGEAEGMQLYYDKLSGKKALLIGVTVGQGNYRSHEIHGIFMRDVYDKLTAQAAPMLMSETGGRTKTLPVKNLVRLSDILEPGEYYLYTSDLKNVTDHPLPPQMRDAGYWLNVSAPNQAGQVQQRLTRSTFTRDIMEFTRIVSINKFANSNEATNWNHVSTRSIGGPFEYLPDHITNMNQLGIISDKTWYIDSARSRELEGHPVPGVGCTALVENISPYVFRVTLTRVTVTAAIQIYIRYYNVDGTGPYNDSWTLMDGKEV